jgi:hypothetical protein
LAEQKVLSKADGMVMCPKTLRISVSSQPVLNMFPETGRMVWEKRVTLVYGVDL